MTDTPREIAQQLHERLPQREDHYTLNDLRKVGIPDFVVSYLKSGLVARLHHAVEFPRTPWADTDSASVRHAWQQLIDAMEAEVHLPADHARELLNDVVETLMPILIEPLNELPAYLFEHDDGLDAETLRAKLEAVNIYRQYGAFLSRYMERKNVEVLSRDKCEQILRVFDRRVTDGYEAAHWLEMLEPWFDLLGERLNPDLLHKFFAEKERMDLASRFEQMDRPVTRQELLMMLGAEELPEEFFESVESRDENSDAEDEKQSADEADEVFEGLEEQDVSQRGEEGIEIGQASEEHGRKPASDLEETGELKEQDEPAAEEEDEDEEDDSLNRWFVADNEEEDAEGEQEDEEEAEDIFNHQFAFADEEQEDEQPVVDDREAGETKSADSLQKEDSGKEPVEENDIEDIEGDDDDEAADKDEEQKRSPLIREPDQMEAGWARRRTQYRRDTLNSRLSEHAEAEEQEADEADGDEVPMWKRFLSPEERAEAEERERREREAEEQEEFEDEEEPIIDLEEDEQADQRYEELLKHLDDERERFVEAIFKGSDKAYNEALETVAAMDDWKNASHYLHREVYQRNMIDMYAEEAVDFTDRLHSFFMKS